MRYGVFGIEPVEVRAVVLGLGGFARFFCSEFQDTNRFTLADRVSSAGREWRCLA